MAANLIGLLEQLIGSSDVLSRLGSLIGLSPDKTKTAIGAAVPALLAALVSLVQKPEGRDQLAATVRNQDPGVLDDARAAAALMAMNNVYYRFRHQVDKPAYSQKPARLRMNRLVQPAGPKVDFELLCLAVSAINGCEACVRAHEAAVLEGGLSEDHVHDAVRIAATVHAAAVALEMDPAVPEQASALAAAARN